MSDIDFQAFMNLDKKCTAKPNSFSAIDNTLASDKSSRFRTNLLEGIWKLILIIDEKIKNEKLQYDVNRKAAKISVLSSTKINEYEYLTDEEILPSDQYKIIKQVKFTYSPLGRICKTNKQILFEKQIKAIQDQGIKHVAALKALKPEENQEQESIGERFPKKMRNNEI